MYDDVVKHKALARGKRASSRAAAYLHNDIFMMSMIT